MCAFRINSARGAVFETQVFGGKIQVLPPIFEHETVFAICERETKSEQKHTLTHMSTQRKRSRQEYVSIEDEKQLRSSPSEYLNKENRQPQPQPQPQQQRRLKDDQERKKRHKSSAQTADRARQESQITDYKCAFEQLLTRHEKLLERAQALRDRHVDMQSKHEETFALVVRQNETLQAEIQRMGELEEEVVRLQRENARLKEHMLDVKAYENEVTRQNMEYEERYRGMKHAYQESVEHNQDLCTTIDQQEHTIQHARHKMDEMEDWLSFFAVLSGISATGKIPLSGLRQRLGPSHQNFAYCEVDDSADDKHEESQYYVLSRSYVSRDDAAGQVFEWAYTFAVGPGAQLDVDVVPISFVRTRANLGQSQDKIGGHCDGVQQSENAEKQEEEEEEEDMWALLPESLRVAHEREESDLANSLMPSVVQTIRQIVELSSKTGSCISAEEPSPSRADVSARAESPCRSPRPSVSSTVAVQTETHKSRRKSTVRFNTTETSEPE